MIKRNFMLLYLNTGGGHLAPAKVLKTQIEKQNPDANVILINGFGEKKTLSKRIFEDGYHFMCTTLPAIWLFVYEISMHRFVQSLVNKIVTPKTSRYLQKIIVENNITDIVSFHFALTPAAKNAIKVLGKNIRLSVYCTDPFTAPSTWFYNPDVKTFVTSEKVKNFAIKKCNFRQDFIKISPFLINEKFQQSPSKDIISKLREKYDIPQDKKVLLMVGGGEGLPKATRIIEYFAMKKVDFTIIVVCGRNATRQKRLAIIKSMDSKLDLRVYGFVDFMDELVKICDIAIIKAGASTVLEVCKMKKIAIISSYIHGQEKGNMEFVVNNHVGFFIQNPIKICKKVIELFNDEAKFNQIKANYEKLAINTDCSLILNDLLS